MRFFILCALLISCSTVKSKNQYSDKHLKKQDAPEFLVNATPHKKEIDDVEYFIKKTNNVITYELKYEENDEEVSISFDDQGNKTEEERDIKYSSLPQQTRDKIKSYLDSKYSHYRILECEKRFAKGANFIDVEIKHKGGPTGIMEVTFSPEGEYVSEEPENNPQIETLN